MPIAIATRSTKTEIVVWLMAVAGIAAIAGIDYATGVELRVYPLYFAPISLVAWHQGKKGAILAALLCTVVWFGSNYLAGKRYSTSAILVANTGAQAVAFLFVGVLIATLTAALERERGLSRTDALTGLLNMRAFYDEAGAILSLCRRKGRPVTLAYVDLDNFKAINDTFGHQSGDTVLRRVAVALRDSTRPSDLSARLGGDEFALLLADTDAPGAAVVLERLRLALVDAIGEDSVPVTCSIGAATFVAVSEKLEVLVRAADAQMYTAKARGKNQTILEIVEGAAASGAGST